MKKSIIAFLPLTFLFASCSTNDTNQENRTTEDSQTADNTEVLAENLEVPWSIEKDEDTFYMTEREGTIVQLEDGDLNRQQVHLDEDVSTAAEAGLLGFVLSPDFSQTNEAFAYYTYENEEEQFNRIVRLQLSEDQWQETEVLLDQIPSGSYHQGGRLKIGPDNNLYATTGDATEPSSAQDTDSLGGKILRLSLDGTIPEDNPMENSYVYSYGHRNSQGITWSEDGQMYASEHGDDANDEVNLIEAGENYGWPEIEGEEEQEDMVAPLFTSGEDETWAPSGATYHDESLYVAALRGSAVLEFDLENNEVQTLVSDFGRIRDTYVEDDDLYFITNNLDGRGNGRDNDDRLVRINLTE
ncbi:PQQ-dependent sugar dehydrogenase [Tetragenococcus muriaticus]|uniref:PQQ-dependent sugar dehydrogenase n=2 Tax=Tetragenococcus muriaticus TaxID=64642 RepID=UPI00040531D3|nr:sorbosone dehydrogenase family protein [Tetragenococcus muriaticus]GMA47473.1 dehydrogenase [Tetragenococcus muriaticus]